VVSSQAYGNGTYYATESTGQSNTVTTPAFTMFDNNINTYYEQKSAGPNYLYNGGILTGASGPVPSTTISTVSVAGWWVQIQAPTSFILRNYTIVGRQSEGWWSSRAPDTFWIAGSTDGSNWSNVHFQSGATYPQLGTNFTVPLTSNSLPYSYYRMVVSKLNGNADILNIASWNLYGDSPSYTTGSSDFYADRLGNLLTAPVTGTDLATWLGGATGYVATWYDQSGAGNHVTQPVASNQPTITPGVINFNGSNQWFSNASPSGGCLAACVGTGTKYTYSTTWQKPPSVSFGRVLEHNARNGGTNNASSLLAFEGTCNFSGESNDTYVCSYTVGSQTSVVMRVDNTTTNNIRTRCNGVDFTNASPGGAANLVLNNYWFNVGRKYTGGEYFNGTMKNIFVFSTAISDADTTILDTWQRAL